MWGMCGAGQLLFAQFSHNCKTLKMHNHVKTYFPTKREKFLPNSKN